MLLYQYALIALVFLFIIPGCSKQRLIKHQSNSSCQISQDDSSQASIFLGPELYGVPVPFYTSKTLCDGNSTWRYQTALPMSDLIDFFTQNMDQCGWQCDTTIISNEESLLLFSTPCMICCVCIHACQDGGTEYILFLQNTIRERL